MKARDLAKAHVLMALLWSMEAAFDEASPEGARFHGIGKMTTPDLALVKKAYRNEVYRLVAEMYPSTHRRK